MDPPTLATEPLSSKATCRVAALEATVEQLARSHEEFILLVMHCYITTSDMAIGR